MAYVINESNFRITKYFIQDEDRRTMSRVWGGASNEMIPLNEG